MDTGLALTRDRLEQEGVQTRNGKAPAKANKAVHPGDPLRSGETAEPPKRSTITHNPAQLHVR